MARRVGAASLCALFGLLFAAGPVSAASVTFGTGSGSSSFGHSITFTQPYSGTIRSASVLLKMPVPPGSGPSAPGPLSIPLTGISSPLTFPIDTSGGGFYPNETITAGFEVVLTDGTVQQGPQISVTYSDTRFPWQVIAGSHVTLHYYGSPSSFGQQLLGWAEGGATKAASYFSVTDPRPIDFFVYPNNNDWATATGAEGTVGGLAFQSFRTCYAVVEPGNTIYGPDVMPHEVTHVIFEDAVENPYHSPPVWLDEGFARYMSIGYDSSDRQQVTSAAQSGELLSLLAFTDSYPLDPDRIGLAYAEGASAVAYMVQTYGQTKIQKMITEFAQGASNDDAFQSAFGVDVAGFNAAWMAANGATPKQYGPQPAPVGPLPPGWTSTGGSQASPQPSGVGPGASGSPSGSDAGSPGSPVLLLLAGILGLAGFAMVGTSLYLIFSSQR